MPGKYTLFAPSWGVRAVEDPGIMGSVHRNEATGIRSVLRLAATLDHAKPGTLV